MENHPIPQDITGFQFKLIGNMTVKQFLYLASGAILGWIFYSSPIFFLIKIPLAIFSFSMGVAFAFVPISGRSMDTMFENFIKAMFSPTQFIYEKKGGLLFATPQHKQGKKKKGKEDHEEELKTKAVNADKNPSEDEKKKEMVYFSSLSHLSSKTGDVAPQVNPVGAIPHAFDNIVVGGVPLQNKPQPKKDDHREREMEAREEELEKELALSHQHETSVDPAIAQKAHAETLSLEEELRKTAFEKSKLEAQLVELNKKLDAQKSTFFTPSMAQAPKETKNVRLVPQGLGNAIGLPITPDSPNVISGIVKDPRGNPLPNVLVEVKDGDSNPVRAFKTNGVGQFASATALMNGVYTMDFEDPKEENKFDSIQFEAKGEIILPVEVISTDKREELRRELFPTN